MNFPLTWVVVMSVASILAGAAFILILFRQSGIAIGLELTVLIILFVLPILVKLEVI